MSRKKHFNEGHSPNKSECKSCGEGIDISKSVHQMHNERSGTTHHFDIEGEGVATEQHPSGWNSHVESGTYCPSCHDKTESGEYEHDDSEDRGYYNPDSKSYDY